jgi:predicted dehydrogenase
MLETFGESIDAVTVSTPDHTHAPAAVMAMRMGKHCFCQKPLTHSIFEARTMADVAREKKVVTQMGNQGTAERALRKSAAVIKKGVLGKVTEVHVWTNRPIWAQGGDRPKPAKVPTHVKWDLWLGPAPYRPYADGYHPFAWRGWWDFGTGALGDMACHTANLPFMALKLGHPTSIVAEAGDVNPETCPSYAIIQFEFPARGNMPPLKFTWYEGRKNGELVRPPTELLQGQKASASASLLVGEKGTLYSPDDYGARYVLLPQKEFEGYQGPPETLPRNGKGDDGMKAEWVAAIRGGPPAMSNFNYAALLTETILLGNVAIKANGKKLLWDGPSLRITNDAAANQHLKREYRRGWEL